MRSGGFALAIQGLWQLRCNFQSYGALPPLSLCSFGVRSTLLKLLRG